MEKSMLERYIASMVLGGVGDAMGFRNAGWEFCMSGPEIHKELKKMGGVKKLHIKLPSWRVSDDTVMQLATGDGLVAHGTSDDKESLYLKTAAFYKDCMQDMRLRSAGNTSRGHAYALQPQSPRGYQQPFNPTGGGCGAAMRAMCIGLRYPREEDLNDLVACAVESGRMTHHHPTGYLGSVAAALFTSYSLQGKPVREWGAGLMEVLEKAKEYVISQGRCVDENLEAWSYFHGAWISYLKERGITDGQSEPRFPKRYGVAERDSFYKGISFHGWGGASGHDAPIIAYDALLGSKESWIEACERGVLHGGDNDSTGTIMGACFGAMYGFEGVPEKNYKDLEYCERLIKMAVDLYKLSQPGNPIPQNTLNHLPINLPAECLSEEDGTPVADDDHGVDCASVDKAMTLHAEPTADNLTDSDIAECQEDQEHPKTDNSSDNDVPKCREDEKEPRTDSSSDNDVPKCHEGQKELKTEN